MFSRRTDHKLDSGRLWFDGKAVCYESKTFGAWQLSLDEIRVIGEYTTDLGPFTDDYFICFAAESGRWWEASYYAEGFGEILKALGDELKDDLFFDLYGSTDYASHIVWPPHLVGQPMFDFTDATAGGVWQRLVRFFYPRQQYTLTERVRSELANVPL
ncbi:MAG: hypothetical protein DHS20C16_20670 [Phycisphaerae bacterium]|nr:MAG: hypothetical protein DHS20C16_20670 [Phycisphaerae bacterium]